MEFFVIRAYDKGFYCKNIKIILFCEEVQNSKIFYFIRHFKNAYFSFYSKFILKIILVNYRNLSYIDYLLMIVFA